MTDYREDDRPDSYPPTLGDLAAAVGLILGAVAFLAWRRWRP